MDNETRTAIAEAEALSAMFASSGWAIAERVFTDYIKTMKDISTIDTRAPDVAQVLRDRINVTAVLEEWMNDLKGRVSNAQHMMVETKVDKTIERR